MQLWFTLCVYATRDKLRRSTLQPGTSLIIALNVVVVLSVITLYAATAIGNSLDRHVVAIVGYSVMVLASAVVAFLCVQTSVALLPNIARANVSTTAMVECLY